MGQGKHLGFGLCLSWTSLFLPLAAPVFLWETGSVRGCRRQEREGNWPGCPFWSTLVKISFEIFLKPPRGETLRFSVLTSAGPAGRELGEEMGGGTARDHLQKQVPSWLMGRWVSGQDLKNPSAARGKHPSLPHIRDKSRQLHHHEDSSDQSHPEPVCTMSTISEVTTP